MQPPEPRELGIVLSAWGLEAVQERRKTQTRRLVTLPKWMTSHRVDLDRAIPDPGLGAGGYLKVPHQHAEETSGTEWMYERLRCRYQVTDRLWVKEAWRTYKALDECPSGRIGIGAGVQYEAGGTNVHGWKELLGMGRYRHARFMPKWIARLWLHLLGVKVERLHDISEHDAQQEGVGLFIPDHATPRAAWDLANAGRPSAAALCLKWIELHGAASWASNPWVFALSFAIDEERTRRM